MIDRTVPFRPNFQRDWFISFHRHAPLLQVMGFFFLRLLAEFFILSSIGQILAELFFWFFFVQLHPSRGTGHQNGPILRIKNQIKRNKRGPPPQKQKKTKNKNHTPCPSPVLVLLRIQWTRSSWRPKKKKKKSDKASTYHHDTKRRKPVKVNVFLSVDSLLFCFFSSGEAEGHVVGQRHHRLRHRPQVPALPVGSADQRHHLRRWPLAGKVFFSLFCLFF